ncbi:hypothetical protein GFK82_00416 [Candidatus Steffania adelgidicola]|nr:hypothetical protein GFK82_00416 [Candidatus Steffania adelgidicola]
MIPTVIDSDCFHLRKLESIKYSIADLEIPFQDFQKIIYVRFLYDLLIWI